MEKRPSSGIWGGLFSFFEFEQKSQLDTFLAQQGLDVVTEAVEPFTHVFSHFELTINPHVLILHKVPDVVNERQLVWYPLDESIEVGLAAPTKKLVKQISAMVYTS